MKRRENICGTLKYLGKFVSSTHVSSQGGCFLLWQRLFSTLLLFLNLTESHPPNLAILSIFPSNTHFICILLQILSSLTILANRSQYLFHFQLKKCLRLHSFFQLLAQLPLMVALQGANEQM